MSQPTDIHQRIFTFITRGLKVLRYIPKSLESKVIIDQYTRSLTSVGANDNEADGTTSKKDFIHSYTIVRKELKETYYWLRIIGEMNDSLRSRLQNLLKENDELIRIVSKIMSNTSKRI